MSKREWIVLLGIAGVVLVGITMQPSHQQMDEMNHLASKGMAVGVANGHGVVLAVSGMT